MAEQDKNQEKTEQATPKRRQEAREKGQVARSQEVASVAVLGACLVYFYFNARDIILGMGSLMRSTFRNSVRVPITSDGVQALFMGYAGDILSLLFPFFLVVVIAAVTANVLQVGILFSGEPLQPKFSKIDPIKGFQRLFSMRSFTELLKSIMKMGIVGVAAWSAVRGDIAHFPRMVEESVGEIMGDMGRMSFKLLVTTCVVLAVMAVLDYFYQRWEYEKSLKMSRQEVKEEYRHTEGDPLIKARIRRIQREMAKKRMMASVPKADVIITNPSHLAVALKYEQFEMSAPMVVAKGAGHVAFRIRTLAETHRVPIVENKAVAQVLYKMVDVNKAIPENLYRAVAEILAYVYQLKGKNLT